MEVAEPRRVRQPRTGHAGDRRRPTHDVDLRAACGRAGVRGMGRRNARCRVHREPMARPRARRHEDGTAASPPSPRSTASTYRGTHVHRRHLRRRPDGRRRRRATTSAARPNARYGETLERRAGGVLHHRHQFGEASRSIPTSSPAIRRAGCCRGSPPTRRARTAAATTRSRPTASACA